MSEKFVSREQVKKHMQDRKQIVEDLLERTRPKGEQLEGKSAAELKAILTRWVTTVCDQIDEELKKAEL